MRKMICCLAVFAIALSSLGGAVPAAAEDSRMRLLIEEDIAAQKRAAEEENAKAEELNRELAQRLSARWAPGSGGRSRGSALVIREWIGNTSNQILGTSQYAARCHATIYDDGTSTLIGGFHSFELILITGPAVALSSWAPVDFGDGTCTVYVTTTDGASASFLFCY